MKTSILDTHGFSRWRGKNGGPQAVPLRGAVLSERLNLAGFPATPGLGQGVITLRGCTIGLGSQAAIGFGVPRSGPD